MRELMLELLTYEPFGTLIPGEKEYICEILSRKYQQPQSMFHDLFSGFCHYVQIGDFRNIGWLRLWKDKYHPKNHMLYPLMFKKVSFYIIVQGKFSYNKFMGILGLPVNYIGKWEISPQFRKYAEENTYSVIKTFRNGAKKEYIVSTVKKLYYEAGRQVSKSILLKNLPTFVDVFAGTATVAASMRSKGCPPPIVNDYDPIMVCFAWAFTYHQKELRSRLAEFQNSVMKEDFGHINLGYTEKEYEDHYGSMDFMRLGPDEYWEEKSGDFWQKERLTNEKLWENPGIEAVYSKSFIAKSKKKARCHKEFIIRMRSWYEGVKKYLKLLNKNRNALRTIDFNALPKTKK